MCLLANFDTTELHTWYVTMKILQIRVLTRSILQALSPHRFRQQAWILI